MEKTRLDKQQSFLMWLLKPLVYLWMWSDAKRKVNKDPSVDFNRKEPYVMLANHTFMFDVVHVPLRFKHTPFIIATQTLFTKQPSKFLVTQVAHVIPKSKGKSDISTIKNIFNAIKKGYPVLIFPEGDSTFYGETGYVEDSTMKLIKKLNLDVIICNVKGGYLSKPRWAIGKRKRRQIELNYNLEITKERLQTLSPEEIGVIINKALYHNDYEYQKQVMIPHPGKQLAEGLENVVYVCPHCESINTIQTEGNTITCSSCHKEGHIDQYGFIHGFVFDNLIDWNNYQRKYTEQLRNSVIRSEAVLSYMSREDDSQTVVGPITIEYRDGSLYLEGALNQVIPVSETINTTVILRRDLGFVYQDKHYIIKLEHYNAAFLRVMQDKY